MDAAGSLKHVETLLGFLRELANDGIALYEHHFDAQAFGNFIVVLGLPHRRVKFIWDGREFLLSVSVGHSPMPLTRASGCKKWT